MKAKQTKKFWNIMVKSHKSKIPQAINSRSRFNQGGGYGDIKKSKQEVKIDAVERAIYALDEPQVIDDEVAARIARMSSTLKSQE